MKTKFSLIVLAMMLVTISFARNESGPKKSMTQWLTDHSIYPNTAIADGNEGIVYVAFTINEEGQVAEVNIKAGISPTLDAAALEMVKNMPVSQFSDFQPQQGKTYIVPIKFIIQ